MLFLKVNLRWRPMYTCIFLFLAEVSAYFEGQYSKCLMFKKGAITIPWVFGSKSCSNLFKFSTYSTKFVVNIKTFIQAETFLLTLCPDSEI